MRRPLLLSTGMKFRGPQVPLSGLRGQIQVIGMSPGDLILIATSEGQGLQVHQDGEYKVQPYGVVQAEVAKINGSEVTIWVS